MQSSRRQYSGRSILTTPPANFDHPSLGDRKEPELQGRGLEENGGGTDATEKQWIKDQRSEEERVISCTQRKRSFQK